MTGYELSTPLVIGPRLTPAVIVASGTDTYGTVSAEIGEYEPELHRVKIRYVIDMPGGTYEASDVSAPLFADDTPGTVIRRGIAAVLSFLEAEAEQYIGSGRMGTAEPDDGWLFDARVAEWAYLNSDEIAMLRQEIEGQDDD